MMTMLKHSTRATRTRRFFSYRALWQTAHTHHLSSRSVVTWLQDSSVGLAP